MSLTGISESKICLKQPVTPWKSLGKYGYFLTGWQVFAGGCKLSLGETSCKQCAAKTLCSHFQQVAVFIRSSYNRSQLVYKCLLINQGALVKVFFFFFSVQISREVLTNCGIKFLSQLSSRGITELIRGFGKVSYELYLPDSR